MHCASSKSARFLKSVSGNSIEFFSAKCLRDLAIQGNSTNQPFSRPQPHHTRVVKTNEVEYLAISFPVTTNPKRRIWTTNIGFYSPHFQIQSTPQNCSTFKWRKLSTRVWKIRAHRWPVFDFDTMLDKQLIAVTISLVVALPVRFTSELSTE